MNPIWLDKKAARKERKTKRIIRRGGGEDEQSGVMVMGEGKKG
jgi:hypothetical protein